MDVSEHLERSSILELIEFLICVPSISAPELVVSEKRPSKYSSSQVWFLVHQSLSVSSAIQISESAHSGEDGTNSSSESADSMVNSELISIGVKVDICFNILNGFFVKLAGDA